MYFVCTFFFAAFMDPSILNPPFDGRKADVYSIGVILYVALVGMLPYKKPKGNKDPKTMFDHPNFKMVYKGRVDNLINYLDKGNYLSFKLDPLAVDLMKKILVPPDSRLSLQDILAHPWLNNPNSVPSTPTHATFGNPDPSSSLGASSDNEETKKPMEDDGD